MTGRPAAAEPRAATAPRAAHGAASDPAARGIALLEAAAVAVVRGWPEDEGYHLSREAVRTAAEQAVQLVRAELEGRPLQLSGVSPWMASGRLVSRLREAWVGVEATAVVPLDGAVMLKVLAAFDAVDRAVDTEVAQRFVGRLSGPDSARLVVEMAHDMRSAMGSILFLAETLRMGGSGPINATQQRQLGLIYSAALGLNGIVNDVMDLARGAGRLLEREPVPFQLQEIVAAVLRIVRPTAEEKGLELSVQMPDVGTRLGHPAALSRVLLNLVTNALKFTEEGQVRLEIVRGEGALLEFRVSDTGRGMSPKALASLYEAFRARGNGMDEYFSGAGLGLAMCQSLLGSMGTRLDITSSEGRGTTFAFSLELPFASLL